MARLVGCSNVGEGSVVFADVFLSGSTGKLSTSENMYLVSIVRYHFDREKVYCDLCRL